MEKNLAALVILYYFELQSTFMSESSPHLDTLKDIKQMMERSSRFISLSGLSGIAAVSYTHLTLPTKRIV